MKIPFHTILYVYMCVSPASFTVSATTYISSVFPFLLLGTISLFEYITTVFIHFSTVGHLGCSLFYFILYYIHCIYEMFIQVFLWA